MLSVILMVLKIIGIILLIIMGIIVLLILLLLFVPIRYKGQLEYNKDFQIKLNVNWFLYLISASGFYDKDISYYIKIFGIKLNFFNSQSKVMETDDTTKIIPDIIDIKKSEQKFTATNNKSSEYMQHDSENKSHTKQARNKKNNLGQTTTTKKHINILDKLRCAKQKFCDKIKKISYKKDRALEFINNESNKKLFKFLLNKLKQLLKHVMPNKIDGSIRFGFDDPYTTGQVLSYTALFIGFYHGKLKLIPVFETAVLEGNLKFKGRIRLSVVLWIGINVWLNKDFKRVRKQLFTDGG